MRDRFDFLVFSMLCTLGLLCLVLYLLALAHSGQLQQLEHRIDVIETRARQ